MELFQILSCNNDLGSCCRSKDLALFFGSINNIVFLIQIIIPILLMIMIGLDLFKLMANPDDKKIIKLIRNKLIAAVIIFFIPVLVNVVLNISSDAGEKSFNFAACMKESKNVKVSTATNYIPIDDTDKKKVIPNSEGYEKGKKKESTSSNASLGSKISSTACTKGDSSVKLVPNDSGREARIARKANGVEVANYAKSWIGKMSYEFTAQGDLKVGGTCSCSHFVYQVLKHFGIIEGKFIRSTVWGSCGVKGTTMFSSYNNLVPGDVVFKSFGNAVGHVEIYVGGGKTVGCNSGSGVTQSSNARKYTSFIHLSAYD